MKRLLPLLVLLLLYAGRTDPDRQRLRGDGADHPRERQEATEDFAKTFQIFKSLPCDIFLAPHASFYKGLEKAERLRKGAKENPFIDPDGYKAYVERGEKAFHERLATEKSGAAVESPKH